MNNYTDQWGRYHDKATNGIKASSNNGWIYTAYANAFGLPVKPEVVTCYIGCLERSYPMLLNRSPNEPEPPLSRDEVIGLISLKILDPKILARNLWTYHSSSGTDYPRPLRKLNWWKVIKAFWKVKKESEKLEGSRKRNYLWENKVFDAYPLAFRLPPPDVYYVKKMSGMKTNFLEKKVFQLSAYLTLKKKGTGNGVISPKNIIWLQLKDMGMTKGKLYKMINVKKNFKTYFGLEHIIAQHARG